ncbi:MAG TPA: GTPase [Bellilinea sp.]|nr:GTPase [Bellilinea sp.]
MVTIDDLLKKMPPESRDIIRVIWDSLSPGDRKGFLALLNALPSETNLVRLLLRLSTQQMRMAFGQKHQVAIVGPTNVGKSTLYNQFIHQKTDKAEVGPLPGTTRVNQQADVGLFAIIDTPGADAVGEVGAREQVEALQAAREADFLIIVFDAIQGIKQTELELFHQLRALGKPYIVALNKIDLVRKDSQAVIARSAQNLELTVEQVVPVVAKTGEGIPDILTAVAATEPEIVAALGRGLPQFRWQLAWRSIVSGASVSAVIGLTPLPVIDFAPLIVTQSAMVLSIARIYNYRITIQRARELVVTFGMGLLARGLFTQLSKLGGPPGWLLGAAIAASTTVVMGYAAATWFESGQKLSKERINTLTKVLTGYFLDTLKGMGKKRPSRQSLQDHIQAAMQELPQGKEIELFDEQTEP